MNIKGSRIQNDLDGAEELANPQRVKAAWHEAAAHVKAGLAGFGLIVVGLLGGALVVGLLLAIAAIAASLALVVAILGFASIAMGVVTAPIDVIYSGIVGYVRKGKKLHDISQVDSSS